VQELDFKTLFPATRELVFLNAGSFGPQLQPAVDAYQNQLRKDLNRGRLAPLHDAEYFADLEQVRVRLARLLGTQAEHIALMSSTTDGLNLALASIDWRSGDQIVTSPLEHPGALNPIRACARRFGLSVVEAHIGLGNSQLDQRQIAEAVTDKTRAVVLSHVSWRTGAVLDVEGIGEILRRHENAHGRPIDFVVDGAQSVGAMSVDPSTTFADFYCFPGQKWLCGPAGTGGMFVAERILRHRRPSIVSYVSPAHDRSAAIFEVPGVSWNRPALVSLERTLEWIENQVGWDRVYRTTRRLSASLQKNLRAIADVEVLTPHDAHAGLVVFRHRRMPAEELTRALMEKKIYIRDIPGTQFNRVATGFFNNEAEIEQLTSLVRGI
jgi:L-cysteine/cystine lyase